MKDFRVGLTTRESEPEKQPEKHFFFFFLENGKKTWCVVIISNNDEIQESMTVEVNDRDWIIREKLKNWEARISFFFFLYAEVTNK